MTRQGCSGFVESFLSLSCPFWSFIFFFYFFFRFAFFLKLLDGTFFLYFPRVQSPEYSLKTELLSDQFTSLHISPGAVPEAAHDPRPRAADDGCRCSHGTLFLVIQACAPCAGPYED